MLLVRRDSLRSQLLNEAKVGLGMPIDGDFCKVFLLWNTKQCYEVGPLPLAVCLVR